MKDDYMNVTKEEKIKARKQLTVLMAGRSVNDLTEEELKTVQSISKKISSDLMGTSRPLPKMELSELTYEKYKHLIDLGYLSKDIQKALGVSSGRFLNWKYQNFPEHAVKKMRKKRRAKKVGGTVE